jgi:hypothetical protein
MTGVRIITTASSVWTFDLQAQVYTRVPHIPGDAHPNVAYVNELIPYLSLEPYGDRIVVTHPDGSWVVSGRIETDTETTA